MRNSLPRRRSCFWRTECRRQWLRRPEAGRRREGRRFNQYPWWCPAGGNGQRIRPLQPHRRPRQRWSGRPSQWSPPGANVPANGAAAAEYSISLMVAPDRLGRSATPSGLPSRHLCVLVAWWLRAPRPDSGASSKRYGPFGRPFTSGITTPRASATQPRGKSS